MGKACIQGGIGPRSDAFLKQYHDYEPYLGGPFVCIMTQFLHRLVVDSPAGFITWASTCCVLMPSLIVVILEAGRIGATGPLRFPTLTLLVALYFAVSVILPGLWIPAYIWGRASAPHPFKGAISERRAYISRFLILPLFVGSALLFVLDPSTYAWTFTAGCVIGPLSWMVPLLCWSMSPPASNDDATPRMVHAAVTSYSISGVLSFVIWAAVVATIVLHYRLDYHDLIKDCWTDAHGFVRFMTIDTIVLYLGMLAYVGYVRMSAVAETLLQTVFFGPGAALAATMATFELERSPLITPRQDAGTAGAKRAKKD